MHHVLIQLHLKAGSWEQDKTEVFSLHSSLIREENSFPKAPCRHLSSHNSLAGVGHMATPSCKEIAEGRWERQRGWEWLWVTNQQWVSQANPFLGILFSLGFCKIFLPFPTLFLFILSRLLILSSTLQHECSPSFSL